MSDNVKDAGPGKIEETRSEARPLSIPAGKRTEIGPNERVTFPNAEYVERNGRRVENDHSWLMKLGDKEVWLRKADMEMGADGKSVSITASHARDMNLPVEGELLNDGKATPDPLTQASLGLNSASPSATKDNSSQPRQAGQSKQAGG